MQHVCECTGGGWGWREGGGGELRGLEQQTMQALEKLLAVQRSIQESILWMRERWGVGDGGVVGDRLDGRLDGRTIAPRCLMGCRENSLEHEREERADI